MHSKDNSINTLHEGLTEMKKIEDLIDNRNELKMIMSESSFSLPQATEDMDNEMQPTLHVLKTRNVQNQTQDPPSDLAEDQNRESSMDNGRKQVQFVLGSIQTDNNRLRGAKKNNIQGIFDSEYNSPGTAKINSKQSSTPRLKPQKVHNDISPIKNPTLDREQWSDRDLRVDDQMILFKFDDQKYIDQYKENGAHDGLGSHRGKEKQGERDSGFDKIRISSQFNQISNDSGHGGAGGPAGGKFKAANHIR